MIDNDSRKAIGFFILGQAALVMIVNIMLMWHAILWKLSWTLDNEEKAYKAMMQRYKKLVQEQKAKEKEMDRKRVMSLLPVI